MINEAASPLLAYALICVFCLSGCASKTVECYLERSESESRLQFVSDVLIAADRMAKANQRKALHLIFAITVLSLQIILSLSVIILGLMSS